jgi:uncharacterized protein YegL
MKLSRRLPIYFVLDCSESMVGQPIGLMQKGLSSIITALRTDPHALETAHISVIAFAGKAKTVVPLVDLMSFYPPQLPLGGGTNVSAALDALMDSIDKDLQPSSNQGKGDWKPIVYFITDGCPTDDPSKSISRWKEEYSHRAHLIVIGLGHEAALGEFAGLTENLVHVTPASEMDFRKFIKWVSDSISVQSNSVGQTEASTELASTVNSEVINLLKNAKFQKADQSTVTFVGRCSRYGRAYLMKYMAMAPQFNNLDINLANSGFHLDGCYPLDESYFEWSDEDVIRELVNTDQLNGTPACPHCGAFTAFAVCQCGKLLCVSDETVVCPWCEKELRFAQGNGSDSFDVQRSRG